MQLSKRSLIFGAGAAFIVCPARAVVALRNPLVFPGGTASLNLSHPMAQGARYAGVAASGGAFIDLIRGVRSVPINGTLTTAVQASIGPAVDSVGSTVYNSVANPYSDSPTSTTMAVIITPLATSQPANILFSTTNGSANGVGFVLSPGGSRGVINFYSNGSEFGPSGMPGIAAGLPWFMAFSLRNGKQNWVQSNLSTGQIYSEADTAALTVGAPTTPWSIGYSGANRQPDCNIAAVAYSLNFLTVQQLIAWAQRPWDFWYPSTMSQLMASELAVNSPTGGGGAGYQSLLGVGR